MKKNYLNQLDNTLKRLFENAVNKGFFSGAAVGVYWKEKKGEKRYIQTFGTTRKDVTGERVNQQTLFDLASLTKPLCTVLSILYLIENKKLKRETTLKSVTRFKMGPEYKNITIEHLLSHSSGLIAYKPFFEGLKPEYTSRGKNKLIQTLLSEPLAYETGTTCLYSDMGYILLGEVIENISGQNLNEFYVENIVQAFDIQDELGFRPLLQSSEYEPNIVATELCPWRNKMMQGEVHDEHSWLMGGVAGHAGLFGSIGAVLSIVECILKQWKDRAEYPVYRNELLQNFLKRKFSKQSWCFGFDTPSAKGSSAGKYFSKKSVGHLGFTGTSFWVDPVKEVVVVLLTNRVHPSRENEAIRTFRPLFHDMVIETLAM